MSCMRFNAMVQAKIIVSATKVSTPYFLSYKAGNFYFLLFSNDFRSAKGLCVATGAEDLPVAEPSKRVSSYLECSLSWQ